MKKATAIILTGIVLLFLFSLYVGPKVFSSYERSLALNNQVNNAAPETAAAQKRSEFRKARLALSSFDLLAGFTNQELENIPTYNLAFPFFYLLACLWLVLGLRGSRREL